MSSILIIDGNNLAHRARHKFINFSNDEGLSSSVVYGGPYIVGSLLKKFPSDKVYLVFDGGRATERMEIAPGYKDREKKLSAEDDMFEDQLRAFIQISQNLNLICIKGKGEEADDIIYTLCRQHPQDSKTIVSSDKDFVQLLGPRLKIYNPFKEKIISTLNCREVYGFDASEFVDYLILKGDKSDKIEGVNGMGDVRIRAFLDEFGSIEDYIDTRIALTGFRSKWDRYPIDMVYPINKSLIDLRWFYSKFRKDWPVPYLNTELTYDKTAVFRIASKYKIRAFAKPEFLKPFKKLQDVSNMV